jgi:hypothetical protein
MVNDGLYSAMLKLPGEVERNNRPDLRADGVIILITVPDRKADLELFDICIWKTAERPPYILDLAPGIFICLPTSRNSFSGQRHACCEASIRVTVA